MTKLSILFAYRNREVSRIKRCLESLKAQHKNEFEVIFVDYGSDDSFSKPIKKTVETFEFANYTYVAHPGLLWNKSKALNFAVRQAKGNSVLIADVDILFKTSAVDFLLSKNTDKSFYLFRLGYLNQTESNKVINSTSFEQLRVKHFGVINGLVLLSKEAFISVNGLDDFFHFYGSEDVDFYNRLEQFGLKKINCKEDLFYHMWHRIYNSYDDSKFEVTPRHFNIKKINLQHLIHNKELKIIKPNTNINFGEIFFKKDEKLLDHPEIFISINNEHAKVWHFLNVGINHYSGKVVKFTVTEDSYFNSTKFFLKKILKKKDRVPISMKNTSDMVLGKIISTYQNHNYRFEISNDLKTILWTIQL